MLLKKGKPEENNYYITTAIDYVNSTPHIGTAYEKIGADALTRFHRLKGEKARLQMGNDEHSINVKKAAESEKLDTKTYCDQMEKKFVSTWKSLNINYDGFIRTTDPNHTISVQKLFQAILDNNDIYKSTYEGWYCESCEAYLTDKDLVDGKCPNHKTKPKWLKEENYFFALSKYQDKLLKHIKKHPEFILPEVRRNEVTKMIEMGLEDISVSRSSSNWGIPLPNDPSHIVYVWFDALINYITAVGYGTDEKKFNSWWPTNVHIIGKDIIRFHCVIWPAMLMSAGLPLPKTILAHGFVCFKGEKMSKSLGNVVTPLDITKTYGEDPLRYFLLRETPFGKDTDFSWDSFINRYNGDLANGLGNLVSRTIGMINKYLNGEIKAWKKSDHSKDTELRNEILKIPEKVNEAMKLANHGLLFNVALQHIWSGMTLLDKYINENKPWELNKQGNTEKIETVLSNVVEGIRILVVLLVPFIPQTAQKVWEAFGLNEIKSLDKESFDDTKKWGFLTQNQKTKGIKNLYPRIEEKKEIKKEDRKMTENLIDISEFTNVDLRIAEITEAEKIDGADKLLKLQVNLGSETRQIVAGIAKCYNPDELIGKKIAVVANLKPVKLRGVESQGMLLAASSGDNISILTPLKDVPAGTKIK